MERERAGGGYTVHELAELSGCTVRTLHHYDELGLVRAQRASNGYRRYGAAEVDRLHQVLLYRECGMPLAAIGRLLDDPAFDARDALAGHLRELHARKQRLDGLIASVEKTLACMEGSATMEDEEKFEAFKQGLVGENEQHYGKEVRERWGDDAADASNAKLMGMSVEQYRQTQKLEQGVKDALAAPPMAVRILEGRNVLKGRAPRPGRDVRGRRSLQGLLRSCRPRRCGIPPRCHQGVLRIGMCAPPPFAAAGRHLRSQNTPRLPTRVLRAKMLSFAGA